MTFAFWTVLGFQNAAWALDIWESDPWGRPMHPRVVKEAPKTLDDLFLNRTRFRFWWDQEDQYSSIPATIQIQNDAGWTDLAHLAEPGWISPPLPTNSRFRIWLEHGTRKSPVITADPWWSPMDLAQFFAKSNQTLSSNMGLLSTGSSIWVSTLTAGLIEIQNGSLKYWSTWDGLPDNRVLSVLEKEDILLVGTATGLAQINKQNGHAVKIWDHQLSHPYVQVLAAKDEHLYVGTFKGLDEFYQEKIKNLLPKWSIFSIAPQSNGSLWVGYEGITFLDVEGQSTTQDWPGTVYDIELIEEGMILATENNGVVKITSEGSRTLYETIATDLFWFQNQLWMAGENGLYQDDAKIDAFDFPVWSIAESDQQFWLSTSKGLHKFDPKTKQIETKSIAPWTTDLPIGHIHFFQDSLFWYDEQRLYQYTNDETLHFAIPNILYLGTWKSKVIWISKNEMGWDEQRFSFSQLHHGEILAATVWMNQIWLATTDGIILYDPINETIDSSIVLLQSETEPKHNVTKLFSGGNAIFAINDQGSLFEITHTSVTNVSFFEDNKILSVANSGLTLCVGSEDGLFRYWKGREDPWEDVLQNMDRNVAITAVAADRHNGCWLAGEDGSIGRVDEEGAAIWLHLPEPDIPTIEKIIPIENQAWILTSKGTWLVNLGESIATKALKQEKK